MTKQHVDYAGSPFPTATLDTGTAVAESVRPILNGEVATQATLQRPDENLRTRTEKIRTELEQLKYLSQADRAMVMSIEPVTPVGTITWNGTVAGGGGGNGKFVLTASKSLTTRPFLSPRASTPAKVISRGVKFQTNLTVAGPINPPRAYGNANKYNVQFVNQSGAPVTVTYDPLLFRFTINTDTAASTKTAVINAFNAAATTAGQGITATLDSGFGGDIFASGETFVQGGVLDYLVFAGAADAEIHQIQDSTFESFFTDPLNAMEENDVLAIWYDDHINGLFGGRQQSIIDSPEAPAISVIPVGSLFLARRFPERLHIAIPIATVVNNELLLADGTLARKGIATALTGGASELPAPVAALPPRMLQMDAAGPPHNWGDLNDNKFVGGLQTVLTTGARDLIDATQRKEGMVVYCADVDRHFVLEGGVWKELGDDNRLVGGLRVVANDAARDDIPQAKQKVGMIVYVEATGLYWRLSAIAGPPGTFVAWLSDSDMIGGFRVVADQAARYAIPSSKQSQDMLVLQADTNEVFRLNTPSAAPTTTTNWRKLFTARGRSTTDVSSQIGVDFISSADGTNDVPSVGFGALDKTMVRNHQGASKARVLNGCELVPSKIGAGPFKPGAYIDSGSILFANGFIENVASIEANLGIGGVASSFINDEALPAYPANVYVYAYRVSAGSVVLKASTTPPTAKSTFGGVPTLGTAADYAYVGLMRPKAASGSYTVIWGKFQVSHDGTGVRRISFDDNDGPLTAVVNSIPVEGTEAEVVCGPATNQRTLFPTAAEIEMSAIFEVETADFPGTTRKLTLNFEGSGSRGRLRWFEVSGTSSIFWSSALSFRSSPRASSAKVYITLSAQPSGPGLSRSVDVTGVVTAITENVNRSEPINQTEYEVGVPAP